MFNHITIYPGLCGHWTIRLTHFSPALHLIQKPVTWFDSKPNDWFLYKMQHRAEMSYTFLYILTSQILTILIVLIFWRLHTVSKCSFVLAFKILPCRSRKLRWSMKHEQMRNVKLFTQPVHATSDSITKNDFDGAHVILW